MEYVHIQVFVLKTKYDMQVEEKDHKLREYEAEIAHLQAKLNMEIEEPESRVISLVSTFIPYECIHDSLCHLLHILQSSKTGLMSSDFRFMNIGMQCISSPIPRHQAAMLLFICWMGFFGSIYSDYNANNTSI